MSRASWYRHGKPERKPERPTQAQVARVAHVSVRSLQRAAWLRRNCPELGPLVESGELKLATAVSIAVVACDGDAAVGLARALLDQGRIKRRL